MADLIGQKLDRYTITALLGEGGMASVYRARQETVDRDVAIKVIESRLARNPDFLKRFEREARTIGALSHPHILKLFDFGREGDLLYLVTELLSGGSLADRIRKAPLSLDEARRVLEPIASALDFAHGRGVIHRDLKPQNVLFDTSNNPYLTDFGVAKLLDESTVLTQGGTAMGTPAYMAPEQWQVGELDARTDVYALGIMLFEMLSGRLPFQGDTPFSMMNMHVYAPPPPLRVYRTDLPNSVEKVINKALAKGREHRFQSAGEMARAFSSAMTGKTPPGLEVPVIPAEEDGEVLSGVSGPIDLTGPRRRPPSLRLPTAEDEPPSPHRGRSGLFILGAVALVIIVGLALLLIASRDGNVAPTATLQIAAVPSETSDVIANLPSETSTAAPGDTSTPMNPATSTTSSTPSQTMTVTDTASATPTDIPAKTATPTVTIDARLAAQETLNAVATMTATSWTAIPTLDMLGTINAELTAIIQETQLAGETATSIIVASYTKTSTPTPTAMPTATPTSTLTAAPTDTLTPTATAAPDKVTANDQWTPVVRSFDDVDMVQVPAGCFQMGSMDSDGDERPSHQVCFDQPFWIDRTEVTNVQFARFGGVALSVSADTQADYPREQITWFEARDFCAQRGSRLPTEAEWEYAARGPDSLVYPWGNDFVPDYVVYHGNSDGHSARVGSRPGGASWVGALDMAGNVWEWVNDWYGADYYRSSPANGPQGPENGDYRVVRGGSWLYIRADVRAAGRDRNAPGDSLNVIGFRCVRSDDASSDIVEPGTHPLGRVTANDQWTPVVQSFGVVDMVQVPPGCFRIGSVLGDNDEIPVHRICFNQPFWIDRTEVTNGQFAQLEGVAATESRWSDPERPRESITWFEARDFCAVRGARLPTEAEWEYAARGPSSLVYSWGTGFVAENTVFGGNSGRETAAVGSRPGGVSWVGALDLSGNVWEWTSSLNEPYPYDADDGREAETGDSTGVHRVKRGGSWFVDQFVVRAASRDGNAPDYRDSNLGFRCARSTE